MHQNNQAIRREARACNVPLWRIAVRLGISEPTMTRRLRTELPADEQQRILTVIHQLAEEAEGEVHSRV